MISEKRQTVLDTPELRSILGDFKANNAPPVLLESERYCQIGCDLCQLSVLEQAVSALVDIPDCVFLFIVEDVTPYMHPTPADALIRWASQLGHG